jgi:hypothetical protein
MAFRSTSFPSFGVSTLCMLYKLCAEVAVKRSVLLKSHSRDPGVISQPGGKDTKSEIFCSLPQPLTRFSSNFFGRVSLNQQSNNKVSRRISGDITLLGPLFSKKLLCVVHVARDDYTFLTALMHQNLCLLYLLSQRSSMFLFVFLHPLRLVSFKFFHFLPQSSFFSTSFSLSVSLNI